MEPPTYLQVGEDNSLMQVGDEKPLIEEFEQEPEQPAQNGRWRRYAAGIAFGVAAVALALVVMRSNAIGGPAVANTDELIVEVEDHEWNSNEGTQFDECEKGDHDFDSMTSLDPSAKEAARNAFQLLTAERKDTCSDLAAFAFDPEEFEQGEGHKHYMHVHHKFASDCKSETYKLHFFIGSDTEDAKQSSFVVQVSKDRKTKAWQLLHSDPNPCGIQVGSASSPQAISTKTKMVKRAAKFATNELGYQLEKSNCLEGGKLGDIESIENAVVKVIAGMTIEMTLRFASPKKVARVIVFERCGGEGECSRQLRLPGGADVCTALEDATKEDRRLENRRLGAEPDDPTELMVAQRQHFFEESGRRLAADRNPLVQRNMKEGAVAAEHDPRAGPCFEHIAVYNQGSCGSCYANAIAQMMGIRKCLADTGRRLIEEETIPELEEAETSQVEDAAILEERRLGGETCADSSIWKMQQNKEMTCKFFAKKDPGCTKYRDYGQRTHCRKTCNKCPEVVSQNSNANPWKSTKYNYMPSVDDLAQCAKDGSGSMQGCDGGNTQGVWNNWMKSLNRKVWVMGQSCKPYTMKCKSSSGVVNPLSGGGCSKYTDYETWHKPCSCIGKRDRPRKFQCPGTSPSTSCGFEVPNAFFTVSGVAHGLTIRDAVLNMQRHIAEFGPIYVSFATTNAFMHWDWAKKPVYTGGSSNEGGHAVIAVGWGTQNKIDYWLLRNSWGGDWAEKGYAKFKRGVNLDKIEDSTAASMPTANFKDWSPPVCRLAKWGYSYGTSGSRLSSYSLTMQVQCNKACSLKIFTSVRLTSRKQIEKGVSGSNMRHTITKANANHEVAMEKLDLLSLKFGKSKGDMWVQIQADDGKGNKASSSNFVSIPKAPW